MSIREIRKNKGMKIKDVAAAIGVSLSTINMWECGHRKPKMSNIIKLSKIYGVCSVNILAAVNGVDKKALTRKIGRR